MYSKEQRMKAIELYIKYDKSAAAVIHELDYPSRHGLPRWYKAYLEEQETGVAWDQHSRYPKYSLEQKVSAVDHYLEHGRNLSRTIRTLGYPCRSMLRDWCEELMPGTRKRRVRAIQYSQEQKIDGVIALGSRTGSAKEVAKDCGVTRAALYKWKNDLLGKESSITLAKKSDRQLPDDKDTLLAELESLKKQIHRLQLEKDVLEATAEIIKKDPGVDRKRLTNQEKTQLVGTLINKHRLQELLDYVELARSSFFLPKKSSRFA